VWAGRFLGVTTVCEDLRFGSHNKFHLLVFSYSRKTGFDLGLLTLKAVPCGAVERLLTCKQEGILTYFQRKVNKNRCSILDTGCWILDTRFSMLDARCSAGRGFWGEGFEEGGFGRRRRSFEFLVLSFELVAGR
jgi:hypothetical protein